MGILPSVCPYFLPDRTVADPLEWTTIEVGPADGRLRFDLPLATPALIQRVADSLLAAQAQHLAHRPVEAVARSIDRAINRWLDPFSSYRRVAEAILPITTGYTSAMIRKGLAGYLAQFRYENLMRLLEDELGDPGFLDHYRPRRRASGLSRAYGFRLVAHIWSGNVPGLAAQSLVAALLTKSACLGKVASEEPIFPALFAQSLAEVDPELGSALAVLWWPGGSPAVEEAAFTRAGAVVAYGGIAAIEGVRTRVPSTARFIPYGHKLSFGLICREALAASQVESTALRAAYDASKFDQQGCLSPHLFYIERGGETDVPEFAHHLAKAMAIQAQRIPRGRLTVEESAQIREARSIAEFGELGGESVQLYASQPGTEWTVVYDQDPTFTPSCLNRFIRVKPLDDASDVARLLEPVQRYLQTAGLAASDERQVALADLLGSLGLDRICPIGQMPDPAVGWHHDGRFNVLDLVRWTDLESPSSVGHWEFEHPDLGVYGEAIIGEEVRDDLPPAASAQGADRWRSTVMLPSKK